MSNNLNISCKNNVTKLGSFSGAPRNRKGRGYLYGAAINNIKRNTPQDTGFQVYDHLIVTPPWKAEKWDRRFMNTIKALNEPHVETYKEIILSPIPDEPYEKFISPFNNYDKLDLPTDIKNDKDELISNKTIIDKKIIKNYLNVNINTKIIRFLIIMIVIIVVIIFINK